MEKNKLTARLLAEGYTIDQTPPGCRPWNKFYGGWTYNGDMLRQLVFETPCGLLQLGIKCIDVGYNGIDWCAENDNPVVLCPRFKRDCILRDKRCQIYNGGREALTYCACSPSTRAYKREYSVNKAHDEVWAVADEAFTSFAASKGGRVCKEHCTYSRTERQWHAGYDPETCAHSGYNCNYCPVLNKTLTTKRGNVFYDVKKIWTIPAQGLIPAEQKISIQKGVKLLDRTVSLDICEAIVKYGRHNIIKRYMLNHSWDCFHDPTLQIALINFRAARVDTRDLMQDLQDVANGIVVHHAADDLKAEKEQKRQRREATQAAQVVRYEKLILKNGFVNLDKSDQRRAMKLLDEDRINELENQRYAERDDRVEQLTMF